MSNVVTRARTMAEATPTDRNRYVDFLRAISIMAVVVGHWLIAAPWVVDGALSGHNMLSFSPWTQWLTWAFQVMPVFFMVGGYSNAVSWKSSRAKGTAYNEWLAIRLRRLLMPTIPLVVAWTGIGLIGAAVGLDPDLISLGSQAALVPVWFLAVYVTVVAVTPIAVDAWDRHRWNSLFFLATVALVIDVLGALDVPLVGWLNFLFVWAAVHQVGIAWHAGAIGGLTKSLPLAAIAGATLIWLVAVGPYPISMVGVPGADASNNSPPTFALLAFGLTQVGVLLAAEAPARRMLHRARAWTATVLVNGFIMSLYLWHLTAMVLLIGASLLAGGAGLDITPDTALWWQTRPVWLAILTIATLPLVAGFVRFDQVRRLERSIPASRTIAALVSGCVGLALLAGAGIQGDVLGLNPAAVGLSLLAGLLLREPTGGQRRSDTNASASRSKSASML